MFLNFLPCAWRRQWHPTPVLLPGKSHGWRSLVGCTPWSHEESDTTERFHFHFSLSRIGEGNRNPLQCSCLENPMLHEDPGRLQSRGLQRVAHSWATKTHFLRREVDTFLKRISVYIFLVVLGLHCCKQGLLSNCGALAWRRQWHPTPVLLPGKSHGRRSLVGCSPWGR